MCRYDIYKYVQKLRKKYQTNNPYEIAEILGITVKPKPFDDLKGVYVISRKNPYIYLNDELDEDMERLVLFHELGHHFLHRHLAISAFQEFGFFDMSAKPEREANIFAANYMIEDESIKDGVECEYTSEQLARVLCVPHELLLIKLEDMNDRGYDYNICQKPRSDFLAY